jgi:hypothetical protein
MKTLNRFATIGLTVGALSVASLTFISCTSTTPPPPGEATGALAYQEGVPGGVVVNTVEVRAKVTAIDLTTRKATLMGPDGKKFTVKAPPEAINLDQVKVGDRVKATLTEELVVYLGDKTSAADDGGAAVVALAAKGAPAGGVAASVEQVTGTVTAIDQQKRTATLRFEDGTVKTFPVRSDVDLSQRKVG